MIIEIRIRNKTGIKFALQSENKIEGFFCKIKVGGD